MPQVAIAEIAETTHRALTAHGASDRAATLVARAVAEAESFGNRICGLYYLESYCQQLRSGRVDGQADPVVTRPRPGVVAVDARFGFAQVAFAAALDEAVRVAQEQGVASLAVSHAHTCTALGHFTRQIAASGLIAFGATNASPIVAAPGGRKRVLGTNPMAFSVPDGQGGMALHLDQSTSAVALGKITMAKAAGEAIPEGWAVDAEGQPTTDPEAALQGALVSAGGARGWGMGLMVEVLAAAMTGSTISADVKPLKAPEGAPHDLGQYYLLIDPSVQPGFGDRFAALAEVIASDPGARLPGEGKVAAKVVDVPDALWAQTQGFAG
ncbi:Ldh family oxidoreductase [Pseudaestuariivita atlantica]|uniref:Lactate dehydrogenase n=1 Tax=Pseudaestuariivita atlantica TaxID=1317121 RepID=A0A0L1JLW8_9RHOB|nr:Ldh family oxidoreductase [Pseudaestuariivita atlantica]KNG92745.1 lactate dehydrogenase [Pseudaestuariivita atlantica]